MNAKITLRTLAVGALFSTATPALAAPPHWGAAYGYRHDDKVVVVRHRPAPVVRTVFVREPVVVRRVVYIELRPVVVYQPVYVPAPAPVYADGSVLGTVGGAIIGAAIGNQIGNGSGRTAATAIGAVVGGMIGSQAAR